MGFWIAKKNEIELGVASGAMPTDKLELRGVWGRECLSRLYELDLLLWRPEAETIKPKPFTDEELSALLHAPMAVSIGPNDTDLFHGVLAHLEVIDTPSTETPRYFARLVPTVWLLTLSRTSRVFLDMSVKEIVTSVLTGHGFADGQDFSITTSNNTKRPYVVQYEESDWDFIQRWLEREGLFYWFQLHSGKKKEKLVIADSNGAFPRIEGAHQVKSRRDSNLVAGTRTIWDYHKRLRRASAGITLLDYNEQTSANLVKGKADIDAKNGFSRVISWADHVTDTTEANAVAKLRAERLACDRKIFAGKSDCERLRIGHTFEFAHEDDDPVVEYVVTAMDHRVGYPLYLAGKDQREAHRFMASLEAIPKDVQYRPPRRTPWPRIDGVIRAHIDGDTDGKFSELDEQGRYWVKMPFDVTASRGSKASVRLRLASPYAGNAYGLHMPLHRGAEVLVAHIGGDPDRPVLVGGVPNPATKSPVIDANATQSVVRTASGIHIEHEDNQS